MRLTVGRETPSSSATSKRVSGFSMMGVSVFWDYKNVLAFKFCIYRESVTDWATNTNLLTYFGTVQPFCYASAFFDRELHVSLKCR